MIDRLKKLAAEKAVEEISSGMIVGLGSGSTVQFALEKISEKIKSGELKNIRCVPSSNHTEAEANRLGIPITTFEELFISENVKSETADERKEIEQQKIIGDENALQVLHLPSRVSRFTPIDLTIDGADEVSICHPELAEGDHVINLIKGGGGALLREKVLAQASKKNIIIVDESKLSKHLGTNWHVPIEVIQFAASVEQKYLESLGAKVARRKNADGTDYLTDENNFILEAHFGEIKNPEGLSSLLNDRAGIVENGLFIRLATKIICAKNDGVIKIFD